MKALLIAATAVQLGACTTLALPPYNEPFTERVWVVSNDPSAYRFRIEGSQQPDTPVETDGKATLSFPVLPRECSSYFLGIKIEDRSVVARDLIHVVRGDEVVQKLSVNDLRTLPASADGYHRLALE